MKCTRERLKGSPRFMPAIIRGLEGVFQFPQEGRRAIPFDVRIDPQSMDLLSPQGFANALHAVCCLKPGSAALAAPVCSTFVFMILAQGLQKVFLLRVKYFCGFALKPNAWPSQCFNSPSTTLLQCLSQVKGIDPSEQNQSSWSEGFQGMCGGNILTARTLILLTLAAAKCCFWVLEQPMTSVMEYHPLFQKALRMLNMRRMSISMSHYGAPTPKRTILYSGAVGKIQNKTFYRKRSKGSSFLCLGWLKHW